MMMTPVRMRVLSAPAAQPLLTRPGCSLAGLPAGTAVSRVGLPVGPAQPFHQTLGRVRARAGFVSSHASQLRGLSTPSGTGRASHKVFVQSPHRDAGRQRLPVEAGGERGAGTGAVHAPILPDPYDERRGERHA